MRETSIEKIVWRRQGARRHYVGTLRGDEHGIQLAGRDPDSGVQVALSIPHAEVQRVRVGGPGDTLLAGERCVVLELADSKAISLREVGVGSLHIHALARALGVLNHPPVLQAQGG